VINIPATEVTALGHHRHHRLTQIRVMDLSWDLHRTASCGVLPDSLMIIVNQKKWESLSPKTREILQRVAVAHEVSSLQDLQALWKKEEAEIAKRGIKTLSQSPEASQKFVAGARAASLARMKERMEKAGGTENFDKVVQLFTPN
jgi:TRAP-type C4-dicarboxylate transport system substrate-binding protein